MLKGGVKLAPKKVSKEPEDDFDFTQAFEELQKTQQVPIASKSVSKSKGLLKPRLKPIGFKKQEAKEYKMTNGVIGPIESSKPFIFDENDWLTFGDGDGVHEYHERKYDNKIASHYGQLKLLTTELQFFNKYWDPSKVPAPLCVYVGAAPGTHISILSRLYPTIQFHLYDAGNVFDEILSSDEFKSRVSLFVQYFTDTDAQKYAGRDDVFFISDIRSLKYNTGELLNEDKQRRDEEIVLNDMRMQMNWYNIIKPYKAHLKFRLPFGYQYDWVLKELEYLDGDVYRQAWAPQTSTETRLVPDSSLPNRKWNCPMYEEMLFYHNKIVREKAVFINPITGINEPIYPEYGLTQDYDSTVFASTLLEYIDRFSYIKPIDKQKTVLRLVKSIMEDLGKPSYIKDLRAGLASLEAEEE